MAECNDLTMPYTQSGFPISSDAYDLSINTMNFLANSTILRCRLRRSGLFRTKGLQAEHESVTLVTLDDPNNKEEPQKRREIMEDSNFRVDMLWRVIIMQQDAEQDQAIADFLAENKLR